MAIGRPPKPTAIKVLEGNPGGRPLNKREPKPMLMLPTAPSWMSPIAKREYRRVGKLLSELKVMTEIDQMGLAVYAQEYARYVDANIKLAEGGGVIRTYSGAYKASPWVGIANQAAKNMKTLMVEFGLTPASRTRVQTLGDDKGDGLEAFLAGAYAATHDE